jgi:hypothetical protein
LRLVAHRQRCRPRLCGGRSPFLTTANAAYWQLHGPWFATGAPRRRARVAGRGLRKNQPFRHGLMKGQSRPFAAL